MYMQYVMQCYAFLHTMCGGLCSLNAECMFAAGMTVMQCSSSVYTYLKVELVSVTISA